MFISKQEITKTYNISERTFDRYRKQLKLKSHKEGRMIVFDSKEIEEKLSKLSLSSDNKLSPQNQITIPETKDTQNNKKTNSTEVISLDKNSEYLEYLKKENETLKKDILEKNQMLESANYKVGKLEAQNEQNLKLIGESQENKIMVMKLSHLKEKQEDTIHHLQTNFYLTIIFSIILIAVEIYLFALALQ